MTPEFFKRRVSEGDDGCWWWLGPVDRRMYARLHGNLAHRIAYQLFVGPIPGDLTVDHICFNTLCVNPGHLQLLTRSENSGRKQLPLPTACTKGHDYTPENTYIRPNGARQCRICNADAARRYQARKANAA